MIFWECQTNLEVMEGEHRALVVVKEAGIWVEILGLALQTVLKVVAVSIIHLLINKKCWLISYITIKQAHFLIQLCVEGLNLMKTLLRGCNMCMSKHLVVYHTSDFSKTMMAWSFSTRNFLLYRKRPRKVTSIYYSLQHSSKKNKNRLSLWTKFSPNWIYLFGITHQSKYWCLIHVNCGKSETMSWVSPRYLTKDTINIVGPLIHVLFAVMRIESEVFGQISIRKSLYLGVWTCLMISIMHVKNITGLNTTPILNNIKLSSKVGFSTRMGPQWDNQAGLEPKIGLINIGARVTVWWLQKQRARGLNTIRFTSSKKFKV